MITIPEAIWAELLGQLADLPPGVERVAYLDGIGEIGDGVVTTVIVPDADLHPGYYDVSAEGISQAGAHLRRLSMTRLAQVHTHGGDWCDHSERDDEMAYSQRVGAISIVLPHHAASRPGLDVGTVHRRETTGWRLLTAEEASVHVRTVPTAFNFTRKTWKISQTATQVTLEAPSVPWIRRIDRHWASVFRRRLRP